MALTINPSNMLRRYLRLIVSTAILVIFSGQLTAQGCLDVYPQILGPTSVREGQTVEYFAPLVAGHTYNWSVIPSSGGNLVSTRDSANYKYQSIQWSNIPGVGSQDFQVKLTEAFGCSKDAIIPVHVNPLLHAYFYYVPDTIHGCFFNIVNFFGDVSVSSDPNITYSWDFGDSSPLDNAARPVHNFPGPFPNTFTVTLTIKNSRGLSDQIIDYVFVDPDKYKPTAVIDPPVLPNCLYDLVTFSGANSIISTVPDPRIKMLYYIWNVSDDPTHFDTMLTSDPFQHLFSAAGTYHVKLTVFNQPYYCTSVTSFDVTIQNAVPVASFTNNTPCLGEATQFTDSSNPVVAGPITWSWNFGDPTSMALNTSTSQNPTHIYNQAKTYFPTLTVTNSKGCTHTFSKQVSVNSSPVASFDESNACVGEIVHFTNTSSTAGGGAITHYQWKINGVNIDTTRNLDYLFPSDDSYFVSLTATNVNGCTNEYADIMLVNPKPDIDFDSVATNIPYQFTFTALVNPLQFIGNNLVWEFGDGRPVQYGTIVTHTFPGPGNFQVRVTGTDMQTGCSNYKEYTVSAGAPPSAFFTASPSTQCQGVPISFTSGPPGGMILEEIWNYNDGKPNDHFLFPNTPAYPLHTFDSVGTFTVIRTINPGKPTEASWTVIVTIYPTPTAMFNWFSDPAHTWPGKACADQDVYFNDLSFSNSTQPSNIYKWLWNFGDPLSIPLNTSNQQNPTHIFIGNGPTFNVILTVWDNLNDCQDSDTIPVTINPPIPVNFTYDTITCLDHLVNFVPIGLVPYSNYHWVWNFGDGSSIDNTPGPTSHSFSAAGTWTVTLTLTDQYGCSKSKQHNVTIVPLPIANFTFTPSTCEGDPIHFRDQSYLLPNYTDIFIKWEWDFGDGSAHSFIQNTIHNYSSFSPVGYDVTLTVTTLIGCVSSITKHVQPIPAPVANFEILTGTSTCATQLVQFKDLSQPHGGTQIVTWNWNFGDPSSGTDNNATGQNPTHIFDTAGVYIVTMKVINGDGCDSTKIDTIRINPLPVADFTVNNNCLGDQTIFHSTSTSPIPVGTIINSYSWNFGDGGTGTGPDPQYTYATAGVKNVTLTIVNSKGCSKSITKQVTIYTKPDANFSYSPSGCIGNPVFYTDLSSVPIGNPGYIYRWIWDFGDGTAPDTIDWPTSPNISHIFQGAATSHNVKLTVITDTVNTTGCSAFKIYTINSTPSPVANFTPSVTKCIGQPVIFTDLSSTNGGMSIQSWLWNFDDPLSGPNNTSTLQNPPHTFMRAGSYDVTLLITSINGCTSTYPTSPTPITIDSLPVSIFTWVPSCEGNTTQFTDASIPHANFITSYVWDFGDGSATSTQPSPSHNYATYGIKNVHLTITNDHGCIHDTTIQVLVYPKPLAGFSYTTPNCLGSPVQFISQSTTVNGYVGHIAKWIWNFGDGTPDTTVYWPGNPNIFHTFLGTATSHDVTLTVITDTINTPGCSASIMHTVTSVSSPLVDFAFPPNNCARQSVQFTDLSQQNGGGNILQWNWNFGDPASGINNTSATKNPIHFFSGAGTFIITLTVTNSSNCPSTKVDSVIILALPVANFTADTACLGSPSAFQAVTSGPGTIVQYLWDFGDGGTGNQANPTHLYATAGVYSVKLVIITDKGCNKDTTKSVMVLSKPNAAFSTSAPACASDSIQFNDLSNTTSGSIRTWIWEFGDGQIKPIHFPENPNVRHKYASGGTYNVKLKVTTSDSCKAEKVIQVQVKAAPLANFNYANTRCALMPVAFTDQSSTNGGTAITQWAWNFGDPSSGSANTSTIKNPNHTFTSGGNFTVNLIVTNADGCSDTVFPPKVVPVNAAPLAKFSSDTACVGSNTHFTDSSTPTASIIAWLWDFGDPASGTNNTSTQQSPTHIFTGQGLYQVRLTVTNSNSCTKDTLVPVPVNPKPTAMFSSVAACIGDSTAFTDLSIAPGSQVWKWLWNFGDGGTSQSQNPKHAYMAPGIFNVTLTVTNLSGCLDSITIPITARPKPVSAFSYTSYFCKEGMVNFEDQSSGTGAAITGHFWIFEPGYNSTEPNPSHTFPITDTIYLVTLIVTDNFGCKDTITDSVHVKPGFKFTFLNDTVCFQDLTHFRTVNLADGDTLYNLRWDFGDPNSGPSNFSTQYNPTHQFSAPGIYPVKLRVINSDNCVDSVYRNITVYRLPEPTFSFNSQQCDSTIRFHDLSYAGSGTIRSWVWDYGDGSPLDTILSPGPGNTSHPYSSLNSFHVVLKITNSHGCVDTISKLVESYPCITASFAHSDTLLCANYPIAFSDSSLPVNRIDQWQWFFGDGLDTLYNTYDTNVTHRYANSGTYAVKLVISATISGRTFIDTMSRLVTVHPTPLTQFANKAVCLDQITLFTDTTLTYGAKILSWKWTFGEPTSGILDTSTVRNPSHKYDTTGIYDVKLLVMNKFGCKDSLTKSTRVFALPSAHFNSTIACSGNPTHFNDRTIVADTSIFFWHWNFGEANTRKDTAIVQNPVYQYKNEGTYQVKLIVKDKNGCYDTADSTVVVNVTPLSAFSVTEKVNNMIGKIKLNNNSENADSFYWDFGDPTIPNSTDESPIVTYSHDDTYLIMLVSSNSYQCSDTTYFKYEVLFKGLYIPNAFAPTSGILGVSAFHPVGVNIKAGTYLIQVFDTWGHLMWQSKELDTEGHPAGSWDGNDLSGNPAPTGTYMWKVNATFTDGSLWEGSDIGKGDYKTIGTVTLIR